jgi:hypothetical protein
LKRKKSVTFVDGTKEEDGDINERLLEDYVALQQGGEDQFSKAEIAQFTTPAKVHPANQPLINVNGKSEADAIGAKKKQKVRKKRAGASDEPRQDLACVTYLKEYRNSRATWKFNKNHQVKLLNNLYNTHRIPFELDDTLSSYLSGLQGEAARKRIVESAGKIISETNDLEGADTATDMPVPIDLKEANEKALKAQLKQTKSILRNQEAAEKAYSDEHREKLCKRKRATLVLQSLGAYPSPALDSSDGARHLSQAENDIEQIAKRKKTRRSRKMRTGIPDDDDTDETSSVSSVPSSTVSSSSSKEDDDNSGEEESESSDSSGSESSSAVSSSSDDSDTSEGDESDSETE